MIELYQNNRLDSGLSFRRGEFEILYKEDGKQVRTKLNTCDRNVARKMRDRIYAELLKHGATMPERGRGRPVHLPKGMTENMLPEHVYYRYPWVVRINNKVRGTYRTIEEATEARNNLLKNKLAELQE